MRWGFRGVAVVVAVAAALAAGTTGAAAAAARCAGPAPGGDWPLGGRDRANTRSQPAGGIAASKVPSLRPAWKFFTGHVGGLTNGNLTDFNATPVVAYGCVFVGSGASDKGVPNVFALNADTGALVWKATVETGPAGLAGAVPGSLAVAGGRVYALVNQEGDGKGKGPYVQAWDARTGRPRFRSAPIVTDDGAYTNATPTLAGGVLVAGFSAPEGDPFGHGGLALVDARTGRRLALTYTVPPEEWGTKEQPRFAGGGVWTTPAIDSRGHYAYMGTGNPFSKKVQHERTDAILKVDIARKRRTFGRIVGFHPGTIEQSSQIIKQLSAPTCELLPDTPIRDLPSSDPRLQELQGIAGNSVGCVQLDLDFGAAANLFRDAAGRLLVGDLQKSGIYHVVRTSDMKPAWSALVGASCQVCNGGSTAVAGRRIFGAVSPGSLMTAFSADGGRLHWYTPVLDVYHYGAVTEASGVLYSVDGMVGTLMAFRASDGAPLLRRALLPDTGVDVLGPAGYTSSSVAVARRTVYVEAGSHVVAYRPG